MKSKKDFAILNEHFIIATAMLYSGCEICVQPGMKKVRNYHGCPF
jgi:hypothetical protein